MTLECPLALSQSLHLKTMLTQALSTSSATEGESIEARHAGHRPRLPSVSSGKLLGRHIGCKFIQCYIFRILLYLTPTRKLLDFFPPNCQTMSLLPSLFPLKFSPLQSVRLERNSRWVESSEILVDGCSAIVGHLFSSMRHVFCFCFGKFRSL